MNLRTKTLFTIGAAASFLTSSCVFASSQADLSVKTVESSHPPYFARVAGSALISIVLSPKLLPQDMDTENSIASEAGGDFKPARYYFPHAVVPRQVLHNLSGIYRYDRRRDVPIVSSGGDWVIAEYFMAGSHIPVERFRLLGRQVQRQEQLDRLGRTIKIIAVGWARQSAREDDEDTILSDLGAHPAWIRVFKVSTTGEKTLVALAWRRNSFAAPPATYDEPDDSELVFGLPDGAVKWRTKADFLKAENIDLNAKRLWGSSVSTARQ